MMNELNEISIKLNQIFKLKEPKYNKIDDVLELLEQYRKLYKKANNSDIYYYLFGTNFLKNLNEYLKYLLKRKEMSEKSSFPHIEEDDEAINTIKDFFVEIDYNKKIESVIRYFDDIISKDVDLTQPEFNFYSLLLENNCFSDIPDSYINYYFIQVINNGLRYREENVKLCIINLGKNFLKQYGITDYKIIFDDIPGEKVVGDCSEELIRIDNSLVNGFEKNLHKNKKNIFVTLFHELRHAIQYRSFGNNTFTDYNQIKIIKDHLITSYMDSFYKNFNYSKFSEEFDAYSMELVMAKRYLDSIGVYTISDDWIKSWQNELNIFNKTDNRIDGIKIMPLDILFDIYFKEIMNLYQKQNKHHIFDDYPVLAYIYDENGNRFTTDELIKKRDSSTDKEEIRMINEILKNQIISYKEIIVLLSQPKGSESYNLGRSILKNRIGLNLRKFIDIMTTISDSTSVIKELLNIFDTKKTK